MNKLVFYDEENDILSIHKGFSNGEKFKGNVDIGKLILDISNKKRVRGIEIIDATDFFKEFNIDKKILENITDAKLNISINSNDIIIGIMIKAKNIKNQIPAKIAVPLKISNK